jgi:hypothetical protein
MVSGGCKKNWSKIWIFHGSKVVDRGKYSLLKGSIIKTNTIVGLYLVQAVKNCTGRIFSLVLFITPAPYGSYDWNKSGF